jgi:hypothetical protein
MKTEIFTSVAGVAWWRDERILHLQVRTDHEPTEQEAAEFLTAAERFLGGAKVPLLIDRRYSYSPSFGALQLMTREAAELFSAIAYYAPTVQARGASRVVVETFLKGTMENVAIFDDEAAAVQWLVSFNSEP